VQDNVWDAFKQYEVLLAKPTRPLEDVQKAVDEWYGQLPFRPNFHAELDMSKAAHTYMPFWHFACNTACQYQARIPLPHARSLSRTASCARESHVFLLAGTPPHRGERGSADDSRPSTERR
jgi:hypothetical protein